MKFSLRIAPLLALFASLTGVIFAQEQTKAPTNFNPDVYRIGERLTYNINYSNFVSAAHVQLYVAGRGSFSGREGIQLKAHVETTGIVSATLLSINDDYTTYVAPDSGLPYRAEQIVREGGHESQAAFDYSQPAADDPAQKSRAGSLSGVYDLLSILYRVRATPLTAGSSYFVTVRTATQDYQVEIKVAGKQSMQTGLGSIDALATRVNIKNGPDYNLRVFFSADNWHVPVVVSAKLSDGSIYAELAGSKVIPPTGTKPNRTIVEPAKALPTPTPASIPANTMTRDLPFKIGEQLNYQVYLGDRNQPVGSLTVSVKARGRYFNRDGLQFSVTAQTSTTAPVTVKDQMTSYVDPATLLPFRTEFIFNEAKYHTTRSYNLDQDRGAATSDNNRERIEIPVGTHDLLSAFYALRTFELAIQKSNAISIMAVNRPRALIVRAERREMLDLGGQKIPAIMLSLKTDDPLPDRLQVRIWVGDDARHLPLRIAAVTDAGAIHADLAIVPVNSR